MLAMFIFAVLLYVIGSLMERHELAQRDRESEERWAEFDRKYPEIEVNIQLGTLYADFATLRRYLVDYGFFDRNTGAKDGRTIMFYRRIARS